VSQVRSVCQSNSGANLHLRLLVNPFSHGFGSNRTNVATFIIVDDSGNLGRLANLLMSRKPGCVQTSCTGARQLAYLVTPFISGIWPGSRMLSRMIRKLDDNYYRGNNVDGPVGDSTVGCADIECQDEPAMGAGVGVSRVRHDGGGIGAGQGDEDDRLMLLYRF
jgi:hypothetical protein